MVREVDGRSSGVSARRALEMERVLVVSDMRIIRDGLAQALERRALRAEGIDAESLARTLATTRTLDARIVVVDLSMPTALALVGAISSVARDAGIVGFAATERDDDLLAGIEAGIIGFVSRSGSVEDLLEVIASVHRGEAVLSPRVTALLARRLSFLVPSTSRRHQLGKLTQREAEILALIVQGLSNKEIAGQLRIEVPTVKNHVHNILQKMQVRRRGDAAVRHAVQQLER